MTKQEIKQAIENGESLWYVLENNAGVIEIKNRVFVEFKDNYLKTYYDDNPNYMIASEIDRLHKTKAEAEHYLHHANITRIETLPFLTWEEFKDGKDLYFTNKSGYPMCLCVVNAKSGKKIGLGGANGYFDLQQDWDLTEANFYKAYDECVRLFKGGKYENFLRST